MFFIKRLLMQVFRLNYWGKYFIPFILYPLLAHGNEVEINHEKKSLVTLGDSDKFFSSPKSKNEICKFLNNKLVTYIDLIYYIKDCKLLNITDSEVSNQLIQDQHKKIIQLPANIYASLDLGKDYSSDSYYQDFGKKNTENFNLLCKKYEKEIITSDNDKFYYIESCKKRLFSKFSDIELFTSKSKPIYSVDNKVLNRFSNGTNIKVEKRSDESIIKISEEQIKSELPSNQVLCAKLEKKVVAFHEGFFFVENCKLYTISDFNIEIQRKADEHGGIKELSVKQAIGLPQVGTIKSAEVLRKIR